MGVISSRSCDKERDDEQQQQQQQQHQIQRCQIKTTTPSLMDNNFTTLQSAEIQHLKQYNNEQIRQSIRSRSLQHPMPDTSEVDKRFARVLASMDLPPDKAKLLKNYDDEKKWNIICDQEMVSAKDPPLHYLTKLRTYLDPKASRSHRKRKMVGESTSTQVLRDLEISLRTNHIEWVKEFLDNDNQGLDALVDYLSFRLLMMRHEQKIKDDKQQQQQQQQQHQQHNNNDTNQQQQHLNGSVSDGNDNTNNSRLGINEFSRPRLVDMLLVDSPSLKRRSRHIVKLNMGTSTDDIHVCIMCLRAIMNNKYGFNMVIQHREAINSIALSIIHKSLRTKALVLELLAAICLVKGGHEIILASFDNFKEVYQETKRFYTLMDYFINYELFNIDFMVACMQFVNIVVHSVEDMNYRVHLQYEFTSLGLDDYLEKLKLTESEELHVQISAYLDNVFDVASLMEDSETKTAALERVQELEDNLGRALDRSTEIEREFLYKLAEIESELSLIRIEREELLLRKNESDTEIILLQNMLKEHQQELKNTHNILENTKSQILLDGQTLNTTSDGVGKLTKQNSNDKTIITTGQTTVAPPPPPPPPVPFKPNAENDCYPLSTFAPLSPTQKNTPPPIVPKPPSFVQPPPPPIPGMMPAPNGAMTIKRKVQTKYKLPSLNWIALKPNQVRGTIFNELDDEKIYNQIDFIDFEEKFKIGINGGLMNGTSEVDGLTHFPSKRFKKPDLVSLLEHTRLRNIAISRRKLEMPIESVIKAINNLDLKILSLENVEILQKMIPTEQEIKLYKEYIIEKKDVNMLTEEDKFVLQLTKVERISSKLYIMNYMGNFFDSLHLINPQIYAIINASNSIKSSIKFKSLLEIILAFGNYLNSSKRGPAYGFKLQSLDTLLDTKSTDKKMCLLHYITSTVRLKFPELLNFDTELFCIEKAAQVSLENIVTDVYELEKGMDTVKKEVEVRSKSTHNHILKDFLTNSEDKLRKTKQEANHAQAVFKECVEYFGESSRNADANAFFALMVRFTKAFKASDTENEQRRRLAQAAALAMDKKENMDSKILKVASKKQQEAVINELKSKTSAVREKKLLHQDEVYNGALEDILLGLKSEPYRRADAVRRSHRRRIDSHRLSKTMDELEL